MQVFRPVEKYVCVAEVFFDPATSNYLLSVGTVSTTRYSSLLNNLFSLVLFCFIGLISASRNCSIEIILFFNQLWLSHNIAHTPLSFMTICTLVFTACSTELRLPQTVSPHQIPIFSATFHSLKTRYTYWTLKCSSFSSP